MPNPSAYILYPCTKTFWILAIYFEGKQIILTISKSEILLKIMACSKIVEAIQNCLKAFKLASNPFEDIQNYLKAFKLYYYACTKAFWKLAIYFEGNQIILIVIKSEVLLKNGISGHVQK